MNDHTRGKVHLAHRVLPLVLRGRLGQGQGPRRFAPDMAVPLSAAAVEGISYSKIRRVVLQVRLIGPPSTSAATGKQRLRAASSADQPCKATARWAFGFQLSYDLITATDELLLVTAPSYRESPDYEAIRNVQGAAPARVPTHYFIYRTS